MQNESETRLERIAALLAKHGVEFVVIGGQAEYIWGSPRITYDIDLCYRRSQENLQHLATALNELKPKLRGAPEGLSFTIDARSLALGSNFTLETTAGDLDLIGHVEPIGGYDDLDKRASTVNISGINIRVINLDDLIRIKQHINRPKDQASLLQLLAIRKIRDESGKE